MGNVMDIGFVTFTFNFGVISKWGKEGRAVVEVPKYYRADIGENVKCVLQDAFGTFMEALYCECQWDWSLVIWGPRLKNIRKTLPATNYKLQLTGVEMKNGDE